MSEAVLEHVLLIPLLNRFDLRPGLSDKSVELLCQEKGLDPDFMVYVLNSYLYPQYNGTLNPGPEHVDLIAEYLHLTNHYYRHSQLPNVEVHLKSFIRNSGENPSLQIVLRFLNELGEEMEQQILRDERHLLPALREISKSLREGRRPAMIEFEEIDDLSRCEALVEDIMRVMVRHLKGDYDVNLCFAVLFSLSALKKDLACNNRLRERLFLLLSRGANATEPLTRSTHE